MTRDEIIAMIELKMYELRSLEAASCDADRVKAWGIRSAFGDMRRKAIRLRRVESIVSCIEKAIDDANLTLWEMVVKNFEELHSSECKEVEAYERVLAIFEELLFCITGNSESGEHVDDCGEYVLPIPDDVSVSIVCVPLDEVPTSLLFELRAAGTSHAQSDCMGDAAMVHHFSQGLNLKRNLLRYECDTFKSFDVRELSTADELMGICNFLIPAAVAVSSWTCFESRLKLAEHERNAREELLNFAISINGCHNCLEELERVSEHFHNVYYGLLRDRQETSHEGLKVFRIMTELGVIRLDIMKLISKPTENLIGLFIAKWLNGTVELLRATNDCFFDERIRAIHALQVAFYDGWYKSYNLDWIDDLISQVEARISNLDKSDLLDSDIDFLEWIQLDGCTLKQLFTPFMRLLTDD